MIIVVMTSRLRAVYRLEMWRHNYKVGRTAPRRP